MPSQENLFPRIVLLDWESLVSYTRRLNLIDRMLAPVWNWIVESQRTVTAAADVASAAALL